MLLVALATGEWIALAAVFISIIVPLVILVFRSGGLFERVSNIKDAIDEIRPDVRMIPVVKERVDVLWTLRFVSAGSPKILTEKGKQVLRDSKIEDFTTEYYSDIINQVKERNLQNPYQVQEALIEIVGNYKNKEICKNNFENAAFITCVDVDSILLVAAINIRDKVFCDLGMKFEDVDKFDPLQSK